MRDFIHLHVHTQYSILDGQASIPNLVDKAINNGMRGMAVTDHGVMFGIKEFTNYVIGKNKGVDAEIKKLKSQLAAIEKGEETGDVDAITEQLKQEKKKRFIPIIGCEMYVARKEMASKSGKQDQGGYHLVVLAKNEKGYHNLIKLVSNSWTKGFYYKPRTDREQLEKYHEDLIISSACLGGELPQNILADNIEGAEEALLWYKNLFGDDFYVELQRHKATAARANYETYPLQQRVNKELVQLAHKHQVKIIATNDSHFVDEENAEAHDHLICLSTGKDLDDEKRMLYTKQEWFKTREEMSAVFEDLPEALDNTLDILNKIEVYSIDHPPILPNFPKPPQFTNDDDYLKYLTYEGAKKRWGELNKDQIERLDFELSTIKNMGFPGYFLIVQDFIQAARDMGVSVGPGRGSAAGSAVAYSLGITQIDPIKYDLLFERFLNPDRISLPDIDIDFDDDGRGEVLRWVTEKYGEEKVAHIITYGTMATKLAIKDVARVEKVPLTESDRLTKLIPKRLPDVNGKSPKINLKNCIQYLPEMQEACDSDDPKIKNTMRYAQMLEGNVRGTGVHACGTIICRDDITDWVPVSTAEDKDTGEKMLVTQYEGKVIEDTGLIKMDFLGLKTLSIIKEALANIKLKTGEEIDIETIDIEDKLTYELYSAGQTVGTFQFESPGMQKYLKQLKPSTFEDLIAMNALYRPGPMEYIPQFIRRKHGQEEITYDIPIMERYLKDTYGITVYQEQVMLLSRLLGNFTRGQSDGLRKAMGKKLLKKLEALYPLFIEGGKSNGYEEKVLNKIWKDWEKFASYAFNKSHATCYSWIAYQTAYLKAHYPAEYMAAILSRNLSNITELTRFITECKAMKIEVLGPDINESYEKFMVNEDGDIRFGLTGVKGVGAGAVAEILKERKANGAYKNIFDLVQRVNLTACNKKNLEALALAGAFDNFKEIIREQFFAKSPNKSDTFIETLIRYGNKYQADQAEAMNSLFGGENSIEIATPKIPETEEWSDIEKLNKEKELVGVYLSAHPLDKYYVALKYYCTTSFEDLTNNPSMLIGKEIILGGLVKEYREGISKRGNPYGIAEIEDYSGNFDFPLFGKNFIEYANFMKKGLFLVIKGEMVARFRDPSNLSFNINFIDQLETVNKQAIEDISLTMASEKVDDLFVNELSALISNDKEKISQAQLHLHIVDNKIDQRTSLYSKELMVNKELLIYLENLQEVKIKINGKEINPPVKEEKESVEMEN